MKKPAGGLSRPFKGGVEPSDLSTGSVWRVDRRSGSTEKHWKGHLKLSGLLDVSRLSMMDRGPV